MVCSVWVVCLYTLYCIKLSSYEVTPTFPVFLSHVYRLHSVTQNVAQIPLGSVPTTVTCDIICLHHRAPCKGSLLCSVHRFIELLRRLGVYDACSVGLALRVWRTLEEGGALMLLEEGRVALSES